MKKDRSILSLVPVIIAVLLLACNRSTASGAAGLMPQVVKFGDHTVNLLSIGQLVHQFSIEPSEDQVASECYTHRSESMEQVLCWTKTEPDFEPNLAAAFTGVLGAFGDKNLLGPDAFIASPRSVSGFQAIEFEAYIQGPNQVSTIRSLLWATSGNVWHATFIFVTGNPEAEDTVERVYSSVRLEGEVKPIKIHGYVPDQPPSIQRGSERILLKVTPEGEIFLNGKVTSLDDVRQALKRLGEVDGVVLYDRAGGHSPPPEAEAVSAKILFEIGKQDVAIYWLDLSQE